MASWTPVEDNHLSALIALFDIDGVPVLIHEGGRYPSAVDARGTRSQDMPHVTIAEYGSIRYGDGRTDRSGARWIVTAREGFGTYPAGPETHEIASCTTLDQARRHAAEAARIAPVLYRRRDERADDVARVEALRGGPLNRTGYEAACVASGSLPRSDADCCGYAVRYLHISVREHGVDAAIAYALAERRLAAIKTERQAAEQAERADRADALRDAPIVRIYSRTIALTDATAVGQESIEADGLHGIVRVEPRGRITEDDPSIHGEHLLGHEGEASVRITVEVRSDAAVAA